MQLLLVVAFTGIHGVPHAGEESLGIAVKFAGFVMIDPAILVVDHLHLVQIGVLHGGIEVLGTDVEVFQHGPGGVKADLLALYGEVLKHPVLQRQLPLLGPGPVVPQQGIEQIEPDHPAVDPHPLGRAVPQIDLGVVDGAVQRELVQAGEVEQPAGDDGVLELDATDVEQAMLAQHLGLPLVVLGNGEHALHPFHLILAVLAGQPHAIRLEAGFGADEAALAQGLQSTRGSLIQPYLVIAHVDAEAEHGSRADETGDADLEDDAFLYFLLCHPVAEMG